MNGRTRNILDRIGQLMADPEFYGSVTVKGAGGRGVQSWEISRRQEDDPPENGTLTSEEE